MVSNVAQLIQLIMIIDDVISQPCIQVLSILTESMPSFPLELVTFVPTKLHQAVSLLANFLTAFSHIIIKLFHYCKSTLHQILHCFKPKKAFNSAELSLEMIGNALFCP